jgi:hypothetical protein
VEANPFPMKPWIMPSTAGTWAMEQQDMTTPL